MKILHLLYESKYDYFGIGGVGIRAYRIYNFLKARHDITLLCKKYPGAEDYKEIEGLRHLFVGTENKSLARSLLSYAYGSARFIKHHSDEFNLIIEEFSPAIPVFSHVLTKRPVILQIQGYTGLHYFRKYNPLYASILYGFEQLRPRFYKNFIFINMETLRKFLGKGIYKEFLQEESKIHLDSKKIAIIPNGVSEELLNVEPEEDNYILYFGRIDIYGKGLDILIEAYREFHRFFPEIKLVIAGDGRDMEKFKKMLWGLPDYVRKNIELTGWVTGEKKIDILRKALFCIFPSRHEIQPIAVMEAIACGKAVIISDIAGFRFIKKNDLGFTFKTLTPESLSETMKRVMLSGDMRKQVSFRARQFSRNFTWDKIAEVYNYFLEKILEIYSS
jgi:glycosyltransferase involved in cell wall biosynthesis